VLARVQGSSPSETRPIAQRRSEVGRRGRADGRSELESEQPRPLTTWLEQQTSNEVVLWLSDLLLEPILLILAIVLAAGISSRIAQRAIRRLSERAKNPLAVQLPLFGESDRRLETPALSARRVQRAEALGALSLSVARVVIWSFAVLTALGTLGINLGPLVAGAGIIGVALGFGAQDLVRDLLRGISMLVEDQFGVGDIIDAGAAAGVVEEISLRTTRIRDVHGVVWHIPNGAITRVGNMTQEWSRTVLDVEVAYTTDIDQASLVLEDILERFARDPEVAPLLLEAPAIWGVEALGDSSVAIRVVLKTLPGQQWVIGRRLRQAIKREFDAVGIEIPFPQRTVWHRGLGSDEPGAAAGPFED
jgi:moderate conductance mechanosensitive channel